MGTIRDDSIAEGVINILNDDCLMHIFSFFSQKELLRLERVCKHWQKICFRMWAQVTSLKVADIICKQNPKSENLQRCQVVLRHCGQRLKMLDASNLQHRYLNFKFFLRAINKFCPKLQVLKVDKTRLKCRHLKQIKRRGAANLKTITMNGCKILEDHAITALLKKTKKLEHLEASDTKISVKSLYALTKTCKSLHINDCHSLSDDINVWKSLPPNLEILHLEAHTFIPPDPVQIQQVNSPHLEVSLQGGEKYTPTFPHLKELNLNSCRNLTDRVLAEISGQCPVLEILDVSGYEESMSDGSKQYITDKGIKHLVVLPKLRKLTMNQQPLVTENGLRILAFHLKEQIEVLECRWSGPFTNVDLRRFMADCRMLSKFDLRHCVGVDRSLFSELSDVDEVLRFRDLAYAVPLHVYITGGTKSCRNFRGNRKQEPVLFIHEDQAFQRIFPRSTENFYQWLYEFGNVACYDYGTDTDDETDPDYGTSDKSSDESSDETSSEDQDDSLD